MNVFASQIPYVHKRSCMILCDPKLYPPFHSRDDAEKAKSSVKVMGGRPVQITFAKRRTKGDRRRDRGERRGGGGEEERGAQDGYGYVIHSEQLLPGFVLVAVKMG